MHIGIDATCWHNARGYGRHARALLRALLRLDRKNHYTFFLDSAEPAEPLPDEAAIQRVKSSKPTVEAASSNGNRTLRDMWRMSRAMSSSELDVVLFPTVYSYVPVFCRAKKVLIIHDIIAEKYPHLTLPRRMARFLWRTKVALGRWQADALITVSEHSRRGLSEHFRIGADRIHVVAEASDPIFERLENPQSAPRIDALGIPESSRSIVYVGGFNPHKNLEMLVEVFANLAANKEFSDLRLVMVGEYKKEVFHSYFETIRKQVDDLGVSDKIVFTGFLPDEDLVVLLNRSTVLVLPSLLEGFGLPAVEAAACGCPVVATTASPLPDLLGEGGIFVDPLDKSAWQRALTSVLASEQKRSLMGAAGMEAAKKLNWGAAARQLLGVLEGVAAQ